MAPEGIQAESLEELVAGITAENRHPEAWNIAELEAEINRLHIENRRLKSNQSFGYVRGRGMKAPELGRKIDTSKPRVEPIDIPPVTAQLPDD